MTLETRSRGRENGVLSMSKSWFYGEILIFFFIAAGIQLVSRSERGHHFQCTQLLLSLWEPGCYHGIRWHFKIFLPSVWPSTSSWRASCYPAHPRLLPVIPPGKTCLSMWKYTWLFKIYIFKHQTKKSNSNLCVSVTNWDLSWH